MKKTFIAICIAALCARAAADTAEIRTEKLDGSILTQTVELSKTPDGAERLVIPAASIPADAKHIDVFYQYASAKKGDTGYWITPDGRFGNFDRDDGYFRDLSPCMPIFGMKTPRESFVGIVKGLKYEFIPTVETKNGVCKIFPRFEISISKMGFKPYEDIIVDFYKFGLNGTYADMAKTYRKYQLERGEVRPIKERVKDNSYLKYACESVFFKIMMAAKNNKDKIEDQTPENEPPVNVFATFDDSMKLMKDLKAAGVDKVQVCFTGWIIGGHDGRALQFFPVEPKVGGEEKMIEAVKLGKDMGYQMTCHIAYTGAFKISNRWNEDYIARRADGSLWKKAIWSGGRSYQPNMREVLNRFVKEDYEHIKKIGIEGLLQLDVNSAICPPYDCNPAHPQNRQQTADAFNDIQAMSHKYFGGQGSEGPHDHVARTLDFAFYTSTFYTFPKKNALVSGRVPFWQIAYHGIIISNPFHSTINYMYKKGDEFAEQRLQVVEFGGRPCTYAGKSMLSDIPAMKRAYDEFQKLAYLQYEFMENHEKLADGVFRTTYSDGSKTVVNYNKTPFAYDCGEIPAQDYKLFKPIFWRRIGNMFN